MKNVKIEQGCPFYDCNGQVVLELDTKRLVHFEKIKANDEVLEGPPEGSLDIYGSCGSCEKGFDLSYVLYSFSVDEG